jgi:carboxynorspermidine decarboxylase
MNFELLKQQVASTPSYVFDRDVISSTLHKLEAIRRQSDCKVLYSIKSLPLAPVLQWLVPYVDGFSVSSLFEARLADEILAGRGSIYLTTPGIKREEADELTRICSHISCNSLNQYRLLTGLEEKRAAVGLRLNPAISFLSDERYDPCRPFSKLGVHLSELDEAQAIAPVQGLHFHTVFSAMDFEPLVRTLEVIRKQMGGRFAQVEWLNLGGGYLYDQIEDVGVFVELVRALKSEFKLEVSIEPGKAIVGQAGYLLATVIDCFVSDGKNIAVLDTSVNHHPEVFEYQLQPELNEHRTDGPYSAILAGSTCLAGDLFGEYRFDRPLLVGDRLVFKNAGAYTLVKAHRFNGYNLPDIYALDAGAVTLLKRYSYSDYRGFWS